MKGIGSLAICLVLWASAASGADTPASHPHAPYDANPKHLWNRLATPLVERIQTRRYALIPQADSTFDVLRSAQTVADFRLDREHRPALRAVEEGERDFQFVQFRSHGADPFEQLSAPAWTRDLDRLRGETLRTCATCHQMRGILSINTYAEFGTAANSLNGSALESETRTSLMWKSQQFDWGLLKGLWSR